MADDRFFLRGLYTSKCHEDIPLTGSAQGYRLLLNLRMEGYPEPREEVEGDRRSQDIEFTTFSDSTRGQVEGTSSAS